MTVLLRYLKRHLNKKIVEEIEEFLIITELNRFYFYFLDQNMDDVDLDETSLSELDEKISFVKEAIKDWDQQSRFKDIDNLVCFVKKVYFSMGVKFEILPNSLIDISVFHILPEISVFQNYLQNPLMKLNLLRKLRIQLKNAVENCNQYEKKILKFLTLQRPQSDTQYIFKEINFQDVILLTSQLKCCNHKSAPLFYYVQKAYLHQKLTSEKINVSSLKCFLNIYQQDDQFQFMNESIAKILEINEKLEGLSQMGLDYQVLSDFKLNSKNLNLEALFEGSEKVRLINGFLELIFPKKDLSFEKYFESFTQMVKEAQQMSVSIDKDLISLLSE